MINMSDDIKITSGWETILNRPGMYMGKKSIFGLVCFIAGIEIANLSNPHAKDVFDVDWWEFEKWIQQKFKRKAFRRSLYLALDDAGNDDEKAFDIWADWFKEYKAAGDISECNPGDKSA